MTFSAQGAFATSAYGNSTYDYSNTDGLVLGPEDLTNGVELGIIPAYDPSAPDEVGQLDKTQSLISKKAQRVTEQHGQVIYIREEDDPSKAHGLVENRNNKIPIDGNAEFKQSIAQLSKNRAYSLLNTLTYKQEADQFIFRPTDTPDTKRQILIDALWILQNEINENNPDYSLDNIMNYANVIEYRYPKNPELQLQNLGSENMLKKICEKALKKEVRDVIQDSNNAKEIRNKLLNINNEEAKSKSTNEIFQLLGAIWVVYQDYCDVLELHQDKPNFEPALKMLGEDIGRMINNYNIIGRKLNIKTSKLYMMLAKIAEKYTKQQKASWIADQKRQMQERRNNAIKKPESIDQEIAEKARKNKIPVVNQKKTGPMPPATQSQLIAKIKPRIPKGTYIVPTIEEERKMEDTIAKMKTTNPSKESKLGYPINRPTNFSSPQEKPGLARKTRMQSRSSADSYETRAIGVTPPKREEMSYDAGESDELEEYIPTNGVPIKRAIETPSRSLEALTPAETPSVNE
jgi:hypothetical protein